MVLDWEENKSLWVGAEQWLIHLLCLNSWRNEAHVDLLDSRCVLLLCGDDVLEGNAVETWHVLLSSLEVKLLQWRLELGCGSLQVKHVSNRSLDEGWEECFLTLLDGVTGAIAIEYEDDGNVQSIDRVEMLWVRRMMIFDL